MNGSKTNRNTCLFLLITAFVLAVFLSAAGTVPARAADSGKKLPELSAASKTIYAGTQWELTLQNLTKKQAKKVQWKLSKKNIVSMEVLSGGKVRITGKKSGKVKVTATYKKVKYTCTVRVKKLTESVLRKMIVSTAVSYYGSREYTEGHREIIDIWNASRLCKRYTMRYSDAWCQAFVSAIGIKCGMTSIIPVECSCGYAMNMFQRAGRWMEYDAYTPRIGDIIYYSWNDWGTGDNHEWPDHVGIVTKVSGNKLRVIEGNKDDSVSYRTVYVNGRYIRGYGLPDYGSLVKG